MTTSLDTGIPRRQEVSWRCFALLAGYAGVAAAGFVQSFMALFCAAVFAAALFRLAAGRFTTLPFSPREMLAFIIGLFASLLLTAAIDTAWHSPAMLPPRPYLIWIALFHAIRDFRLWRAYGLPFPRHAFEKDMANS